MAREAWQGRILGIDYGAKRVGLAVSDPLRLLARGVGTFENDGDLLAHLAAFAADCGATEIVVGMPYAPDGGYGAKGEEVREFIRRLQRALPGIRINTWDESFTSVEASRVFREGGMKRKHRRQKGRLDEMAARLLLQEYLDHARNPGT